MNLNYENGSTVRYNGVRGFAQIWLLSRTLNFYQNPNRRTSTTWHLFTHGVARCLATVNLNLISWMGTNFCNQRVTPTMLPPHPFLQQIREWLYPVSRLAAPAVTYNPTLLGDTNNWYSRSITPPPQYYLNAGCQPEVCVEISDILTEDQLFARLRWFSSMIVASGV